MKLEEIRKQTHILTPGRFVGNEEEVDDLEEFEEKMRRLTSELAKQINQSRLLDEEITRNLSELVMISEKVNFKKTEIGYLPFDWSVKEMGAIALYLIEAYRPNIPKLVIRV